MTPDRPGRNGRRLGYTNRPPEPGHDPFAAARIDRDFTEPPPEAPGPGPAMNALRVFARPGDTVVVPAIEDLAWNLLQLRSLVRDFTSIAVDVEFIQEAITFGTSTPAAVEHLAALNAIADFELRRTRQRQRAGIEAAKARGVYKGRRHHLNQDQASELRRQALEGTPKTQLANDFGIHRDTVYRYLNPDPPANQIDQGSAN